MICMGRLSPFWQNWANILQQFTYFTLWLSFFEWFKTSGRISILSELIDVLKCMQHLLHYALRPWKWVHWSSDCTMVCAAKKLTFYAHTTATTTSMWPPLWMCYVNGYRRQGRDGMALATYEHMYYSYHWLLQLQRQSLRKAGMYCQN